MATSADVAALVAAIVPYDGQEDRHRADALAWLGSTDDVFRRVPPRTPPKHLVSYVVLQDPADGSVLLVDHRRSGLWLPAGGHAEPGEDPADAARREAAEELGVGAVLVGPTRVPRFVTVTDTVGHPEERHTDVSLWFLLSGSRQERLVPDAREIVGTRWWSPEALSAADPDRFDPHLGRFLAKVDRQSRPMF